jgi:hypothetical protein
MQQNIKSKWDKIASELGGVCPASKNIMKYGAAAFLMLFAVGTALVAVNHTLQNFDPVFEDNAIYLVRQSFVILAEFIIGGLVIDYLLKGRKG